MEALILEINTRGLHRYYPIEREITTIGRALDNDIILSDPTVAPHHMKIIRYGDDSLEIVNLAEVNPTRIDGKTVSSAVTAKLPLALGIGRIQASLLSRNHEVAATRPLAGDGRRSHLFGHASWAFVLVLACIIVGGLDFYLNSYNAFKWGELLKYVLRETVLTLGGFVIALAVLERLLVNRWEIKQLVTSVCLVYLLFYGVTLLAAGLDHLFSAGWPSTLLHLGWYLLLIPVAIGLYLVHISHLRARRSILLALLIASPIAMPSLMQSPALQAFIDDFSPTANYHRSLSVLNWHFRPTVSIAQFATEAKQLAPGEFAD